MIYTRINFKFTSKHYIVENFHGYEIVHEFELKVKLERT